MTLTANQQMRVAEQKIIIEQLRKELQYEPIYTSIAIKELISYVETNQKYDVLASGFSSQNDNPYKEKNGCQLI
jgi:hypothetical protein